MSNFSSEKLKQLNEEDMHKCATRAGSQDGTKWRASKGPIEGNFETCSAPNHQTVGKGYLANGGVYYRDRICLNCGAIWTKWLSDRTNLWEVWNFGTHF